MHQEHEHHDMTGLHHDFNKHEGHNVNIFAKKFYVSLLLTIPIVAYSELPQKILGWSAPIFTGSEYLSFILGSIIFFYGGWIFLIGAWREIRAKLPGMMTLIAIAIMAAYFFSVYATFSGTGHTLFGNWPLLSPSCCLAIGWKCWQYKELKVL